MKWRLLHSLLLAVSTVGLLNAETIVLKSGRRIQATAVEERGDRVYWETDDGRFSLPKRLIERIERGEGPPARQRLAEKIAVAPLPSIETGTVGEVLINGKVNRELIARLENQASQGDSNAKLLAAAAHVILAQHFYAQAEIAAAISSIERALGFAPNHPVLLLNPAGLYHMQRDYPRALEALERAARDRQVAFEVLCLRGLIEYEREKLDAAISAWKQALALRADAEVRQWLERAEREAGATAGYRQTASGRFTLRASGEAAASPRLVHEVMDTLERDFNDFYFQFNYLPRQPIVVLLYTNEAFSKVTGAPPWYAAIHDGKIRVQAEGLTSLTGELRQVLRHELSHAFIQQKSRDRAPRWLHEGLAQWLEGMRSSGYADALRQVVAQGRLPLDAVEVLFQGSSFEEVFAGYLLALVVVETMIDTYRMSGINRLLEELGRGASLDAALHTAYRIDSAELERKVLDSLRRRYTR